MFSVLGSSHIVVGVRDESQALQVIHDGRTELFRALSQSIPPQKKPFLATEQAFQSALYSHHGQGIGIEALWHETAIDPTGRMPYSVAIEPDGAVRSVTIFSSSAQTTRQFIIDCFGGQSLGDSRIAIKSFVRRDLELVCAEAPDVITPFLDYVGYSCLSLDVKKLVDALAVCAQSGAMQIGEPFVHATPSRAYAIAFVRGPTGELYELLETIKVTR